MSTSKPGQVKFIKIKLRNPFFAERILKRISQIPGVVSVTQTQPDNVVIAYQKLCIMQVEASALENVLAALKKDADIESAEQAPKPRLMN